MPVQVYYITEFSNSADQFKFQAQIEAIFREKGFISIQYPRNYFSRLIFLAGFLRRLVPGSIIFFIHPLYSRTNQTILRIAQIKKSIPVCLVSDINSLRDETIQFDNETSYWKKLMYFIFQNDTMKRFVEKKLGTKKSVNLELFDLLFPPVKRPRSNAKQVVFAGNIAKCPFIHDLHRIKQIQWLIYTSSSLIVYENIVHHELKDEVSVRKPLQGSYGLIWEGDTIENISNFKGQYLSIVTPLKLSNYLLNGLPVITHTDAAIAGFVIDHQIGFCVDTLYDIPEKINAIPEEEYQQMRRNAEQFSGKIASGHYTGKAIDEMLEIIQQDQLS